MKTIKEIMVLAPQHCTRNETLKDISIRMHKANIGSLPVLDENKKVVGIITDRDIALSLGKHDNKPHADLKVHEIMTSKVHTISPEESTTTALKIMRTNMVGRLPVVDNKRELKGMVSLNRILRDSRGTKEADELEYAGEENVLLTLHSIAERNAVHHSES
ncbi:MAG: CBS domain-containing protein [Bacteroidia bacterium]